MNHENLDPDVKQEIIEFYSTTQEIVNIIVAFDMGWSKRGNGRSYDSLNGYATIIGFLSGKVLDYATRNRKCNKCDKGTPQEEHNCRLNFNGSAKAMEAHAGVELITKSKVLEKTNCSVKCVIGDEDSSTMAAIRKDNPKSNIHKLADKNHLIKNFGKEVYELAKKVKN